MNTLVTSIKIFTQICCIWFALLHRIELTQSGEQKQFHFYALWHSITQFKKNFDDASNVTKKNNSISFLRDYI